MHKIKKINEQLKETVNELQQEIFEAIEDGEGKVATELSRAQTNISDACYHIELALENHKDKKRIQVPD